ncbi:MAG: hypothetical protein K0Q72_4127 [Armatimonadetes bacterium]|jgi:hypothetical protein|nr:hypothetical protein [Armatimonadota bacterium]
MKGLFTAVVAAALLAAVPASAQETPSLLGGSSAVANFFGSTGLLTIPSAYTVGDRGIGAHAYFAEDFESYGARVGLGSRLEVGATFLNADSGNDGVLLNAKFTVLQETLPLPGVAIGIVDAFDELDLDPSFYVVASKDLSRIIPLNLFPIRAHAGWGTGIYDEEPFFGLEMNLGTPLDVLPIDHPVFSGIAEYANQNVNLGLRGRFKGFAATVSLFDFDSFGGGISYTTGLRIR